jgi:acetylornithine deacetylase/succinyl-diaminopimelate desuccinylase-like protein
MPQYTRRDFVTHTAASGAALWAATNAGTAAAVGHDDMNPVYLEIQRRHDESIARMQAWIKQPSISAEDIGMTEGAEMMRQLALDAGFQHAEVIPTKGHPGVFATLDAGAKTTVGLYFMYDVKQADPAEWSSPPWDAKLVERPGLGTVLVGRGATNQKGPQSALLAALHAIRGGGKKIPVNLVLVAEGEEEVGSPNFPQVVHGTPQVKAALEKCIGIYMPSHEQELDGSVIITLGSKGDIECDLIASGAAWGRGPSRDIHSSQAARLDQPAWRLVQALNTLVTAEGEPAIDGFFEHVRPVSADERAMLDVLAERLDQKKVMEGIGVKVWARNANWRQALEDLVSRPTVTIEGLVGGYTGPGGKTILPTKMTAKLDMRLVPDMTPEDIVPKLKAHLAKRGFGDIEVKINGGWNYTSATPVDSKMIQAQRRVYQRYGIDAMLTPRSGGSWPGSVFTGEPLKLPAGHFGLGVGERAHAPDEWCLIRSSDPKLHGMDDMVRSSVDFLFELGK